MADKGAVLLWGARSQARIVSAILARQGMVNQLLFDHSLPSPAFSTGVRFVQRPEELRRLLPDCAFAVVCIGGRHGAQRVALSQGLRDHFGLKPFAVVSPDASIDPEAVLGDGVQILQRACIGLAAGIGDFSIVNSNATVDHECRIGAGVHIMGGAAIAGRVTVGDFATIGTNATILPDITIGPGAQVGAATLVRRNVDKNTVVVGVPARLLRPEMPEIDLSIFNAI